jgi:hypothetical protein
MMIRYLIGVDDTDSLKSPTTGELVRRLAGSLQVESLVEPRGVTRHQLLVKKQIPYTAHNSAVCMSVDTADMEGIWETVRDFLAFESERHSNVAVCISRWDAVGREVMAWGRRAKEELLTLEQAQQLAAKSHVRSVALKGNGMGLIGALAALGLHREGDDGRFLWMPGLLDLQGSHSVAGIFEKTGIERVCTLDEVELPLAETVELGDWTRPVLRHGQATLYVEEKKHGWFVLDKEHVKELSG